MILLIIYNVDTLKKITNFEKLLSESIHNIIQNTYYYGFKMYNKGL